MKTGGENIRSVKEHKAKGNYRPSRHAGRLEQSIKVVETPPDPPEHFDKRHRDLWQKCCQDVYNLGVLVEPDIHLIEMFVTNWFLWQDAAKDLTKNGYMITVEAGGIVKETPNPAIRIMNDCSRIVNQIADKFGFSPRARMGIKTQDVTPKDPLADFLN